MKNKKVAIVIIVSLLVVVLGLLAGVLIFGKDRTNQPNPMQDQPTEDAGEYTTAPTERGPGEYFIPGENEGGMA